jgi:hypothetical protein
MRKLILALALSLSAISAAQAWDSRRETAEAQFRWSKAMAACKTLSRSAMGDCIAQAPDDLDADLAAIRDHIAGGRP